MRPSNILSIFVCALAALLVGCGGQNAAPVTPASVPSPVSAPVLAQAHFVYTGNQGGSLSGYAVDATTGNLSALSGFPLALGTNPTVITHDPQNRFVLVADIAASQLHVLAVDGATGALTESADSPYATVQEPVSVTVDPSGTHIYLASQDGGEVDAFVLSATGTLASVPGAPFATGGTHNPYSIGSESVITDRAGKFLYLQDLENIYTFSIGSSGALTPVGSVPGPAEGDGIALDPGGEMLYAVGSGTNAILSYRVDATSGGLGQASASPMLEGNGAYTLTVAPSGTFAYTIENNNDLVTYKLQAGQFTPVGAVFPGVYGEQISVDPSGAFVYVPQACSYCPSGVYNVINEFAAAGTGILSNRADSPVAGTTPWGITLVSP